MTAKEKLRRAVEDLSEAEAAEALEALTARNRYETLDELLDNAPIDDEPETDEEREAVAEAKADISRGDVFRADEIKREIV